jgi:hypothetical protein
LRHAKTGALKGSLEVFADTSKPLKVGIPNPHVATIGQADTDRSAGVSHQHSPARAEKVCHELKNKGVTAPCHASGVDSS